MVGLVEEFFVFIFFWYVSWIVLPSLFCVECFVVLIRGALLSYL
jgi:hypothetical protein